MFAHQGTAIAIKDHARAAFGTGKAISLRCLSLKRLGRKRVGVNYFFRLDLAIQDGQRLARFGMQRVVGKRVLKILALFQRVGTDRTHPIISPGACFAVIGNIDGALEIAARQAEVIGLDINNGLTQQVIIMIGWHKNSLLSAWMPDNRIGHTRNPCHHFHIMHADQVGTARNTHRDRRGCAFHTLIRRQVQGVTDK